MQQKHIIDCRKCGWSNLLYHSLDYKLGTATAHTVMCTKCSYSASQAHVWGGSPSFPVCTLCGFQSNISINSIGLLPEDPLEGTFLE